MRIVNQTWFLVCLFKSISPNNKLLRIVALISLIERLDCLLEGVVGFLELEVTVDGSLKISLNVSCVDGLLIQFISAITGLMNL